MPVNVGGLCNGSALFFMEKIFYDCLSRYYQQTSSEHSDESTATNIPPKLMDELLHLTIDDFFKDIEAINATDDAILDSPVHQQKLGNRVIRDYIEANQKLNQAIESGQLIISNEEKEKLRHQFSEFYVRDAGKSSAHPVRMEDHHLTLIHLAEQQKILTPEEANILREEHIPDIPLFERFISQIFLLQTSSDNFENIQQHDLTAKFAQLVPDINDTADNTHEVQSRLPTPILEYDQSLLLTPEELAKNLRKILPDQRLVWIGLPDHTVAAFCIKNEYHFYDSNNDKKEFIFCKDPFIFILKFALSGLRLALEKQKKLTDKETLSLMREYLDYMDQFELNLDEMIEKSRLWFVNKPASFIQIVKLEKSLATFEQKDNQENKSQEDLENDIILAKIEALKVLPPILGFEWKTYGHANSPPHIYPTIAKITHGANFKEIIGRMDFAKETVLMKVAEQGQLDVCKELLQKIKDPQNGLTDVECKKFLDLANRNGQTALHRACLRKNTDIAILLLEAGADPNILDTMGLSPLTMAINYKDVVLVDVFIKYGADVNLQYRHDNFSPFILSCSNKDPDNTIFDKLIVSADVHQLGEDLPAVFLCIMANNYHRIKQLLKHGVDANVRLSKDSKASLIRMTPECSALQYAFVKKQLDVAELLLQHGADPNTKDYYNNSCLATQAGNNYLAAVKLLLKYGATPSKAELKEIIENNPNRVIALFVEYPCMAQGETKAEQLSLLFNEYANPSTVGGIFSMTWRHYQTFSNQISVELEKAENKHLDDQGTKEIIIKYVETIPGGYNNLRDGEFKKRIDLVCTHFLNGNLSVIPKASNEESITIRQFK